MSLSDNQITAKNFKEFYEVILPYLGGGSGGNPWTELTGTLTASETSITFTDSAITTDSFIDVYTDADIPYNSITVTTGSIVLTYDAQQSNVTVKVRLS